MLNFVLVWCKKFMLAIKEKHQSKTWSGQSVYIVFGPKWSILLIFGYNVTVHLILLSSLT